MRKCITLPDCNVQLADFFHDLVQMNAYEETTYLFIDKFYLSFLAIVIVDLILHQGVVERAGGGWRWGRLLCG